MKIAAACVTFVLALTPPSVDATIFDYTIEQAPYYAVSSGGRLFANEIFLPGTAPTLDAGDVINVFVDFPTPFYIADIATFRTIPSVFGTWSYIDYRSLPVISGTYRDTYPAMIAGLEFTAIGQSRAFIYSVDSFTYFGETIPEPSIWIMLCFGLGALGLVARSRRGKRRTFTAT